MAYHSTLVVILGASEFPHARLQKNTAFHNSAVDFKKYVLDSRGLALPESSVLDLFDDPSSQTELDHAIGAFLDSHANAKDLVVYYVGHGEFRDGKDYYLAIRDTRRDNPFYTSYPIGSLATTLKEHARHLRRYLILDSCFSAAAFRYFQASAPNQAALQQAKDQFEVADEPGSGTALLCAASRREAAKSPKHLTHTMFTWGLLEVLCRQQGIDETLSLAQVNERVWPRMQKRFREQAVRPELHSPDQRHGDVGHRPIFRTLGSVAGHSSTAKGQHFRDALETRLEHSPADLIQCVIVLSEKRRDPNAFSLKDHVRRAFDHYASEIRRSFTKYRKVYWAGVAGAKPPNPDSLRIALFTLNIGEAFRTPDALMRAVEAMCRADVAVFDITRQEPGVMLLLGVRSVARRGVTISSLGGQHVLGAELALPFNLQMLNVVFHSDKQLRKGPHPQHLIGPKIHTGFNELAELPFYLDLPAYDSVRRLGRDPASYRPLRFNEQVLVLCPFSDEYTNRNWTKYLNEELPSRLKSEAAKAFPEQGSPSSPRLVRLLDMDTPRLVAQTLFESIRRTEMCIVDWTRLRPNVMFELGVRLAVNPLGAVNIVEHEAERDAVPQHAKDMLKLFEPIPYHCIPEETQAYSDMMERFTSSLNPAKQGIHALVYRTVAASFDTKADPVAMPIVEELESAAELLASEDEERSGISQALFSDANKDVLAQVQAAAADRRLAAWSFLNCRYRAEEIRQSPELSERYRKLGALVRRWLKDHRNPYADDLIRKGLAEVRKTPNKGGGRQDG